jgi:hypothetical protein
MIRWLTAFRRCLGTDVLKLRRTPALALAVLLPALPPLLFFVFVLQRGNEGTPDDVSPMGWTLLGTVSMWAIFLVPLFAAIETSLLAGIEHHNRGWKHLLALPVPRSAAYAAKYVAAASLMAIATVSISGYTLLSLWSLSRLRADVGFAGPLPIQQTLVLFGLVGAASLFLLSAHAYFAMRWSSFALNVGLALAGLLGNFVLIESRFRFFYPWALPPAIENLAGPMVLGWGTRGTPSDVVFIMSLALAGVLLVTCLGVWRLSQRDVL